MSRYKTETGGPEWAPDELDVMLDRLLQYQTKGAFKGCCDRIAQGMDRGHRKGLGELVERRLWGMAVLMPGQEYTGPVLQRHRRTGPLTWAERTVLTWAAQCTAGHVAQTGRPTAAYLAVLLNRPAEEFEKEYNRLLPGGGSPGFGLK